jgi:hypothetical protein
MIPRILIIGALAAAGAAAQPAAPDNPVQQRLAALKQSMAQNQAQLKLYSWTETTELSVKGELRKREQNDCRYGPDGKVVRTPIGAAPPQASEGGKRRGLKAKVVASKTEDMKEYMDRVNSLVRRYVPPDPQAMDAALQAGKAALKAASGELVFSDYAKPGDRLTLAFDATTRKVRSFSVATYLDEPKDTVTLNAHFSSLPDGTNFLEESVLDAKAKEIRIKTINFGHRKAGNL